MGPGVCVTDEICESVNAAEELDESWRTGIVGSLLVVVGRDEVGVCESCRGAVGGMAGKMTSLADVRQWFLLSGPFCLSSTVLNGSAMATSGS